MRGLDFYRLDVNWANFVVQDIGCWGDVQKLEEYCRKRKLPFSLIYWASEQPALDRMGLADDSTWYRNYAAQTGTTRTVFPSMLTGRHPRLKLVVAILAMIAARLLGMCMKINGLNLGEINHWRALPVSLGST